MVLIVLLVLALFVIQTLLPGRFRQPGAPGTPNKLVENLGPRDVQRQLTVVGARAQRALVNMQEALPVFLALALMNMIVGSVTWVSATGAWVFLIARILYVPVYVAGISVVRTLLWAVSLVGLSMMLWPLLDRI